MKNHTILELYTDDNKSKYSSNPKDILKSEKKIMKLYTEWTSAAATTEAVCKIPNIHTGFPQKKSLSQKIFSSC